MSSATARSCSGSTRLESSPVETDTPPCLLAASASLRTSSAPRFSACTVTTSPSGLTEAPRTTERLTTPSSPPSFSTNSSVRGGGEVISIVLCIGFLPWRRPWRLAHTPRFPPLVLVYRVSVPGFSAEEPRQEAPTLFHLFHSADLQRRGEPKHARHQRNRGGAKKGAHALRLGCLIWRLGRGLGPRLHRRCALGGLPGNPAARDRRSDARDQSPTKEDVLY